jgi:hypothetical protein
MSWIAAAVVGGAVIGGGASIIAGEAQSGAASDAARTSADAARYQTDVQKQIYDQTRADQEPWRETGANALGQLAQLTGAGETPHYTADQIRRARFGGEPLPELAAPAAPGSADLLRPFAMSDFEADPGYAFRQAEGMRAIERSAAARGGALSGGALRSTQRFGQGLASEEYQNAFNRYQTGQTNTFNRLASMAGVGQTANAATGQAGSNLANAVTGISQADATNQGNAILAAGNARASGYAGAGNAIGNSLAMYPFLRR